MIGIASIEHAAGFGSEVEVGNYDIAGNIVSALQLKNPFAISQRKKTCAHFKQHVRTRTMQNLVSWCFL